MLLLAPLSRAQLPAVLQELWDQCEARGPAFRHLWSTIFRSVYCNDAARVAGGSLALEDCRP